MTGSIAAPRRRLRPGALAQGGARERNRPLRVVVSLEERAKIETMAESAGMSVSAYLRALGLGHQPTSVFDTEAVRTLAEVAGDQGRLGGLLKLLLSECPAGSESDITSLLSDLKTVTACVHKALDRL